MKNVVAGLTTICLSLVHFMATAAAAGGPIELTLPEEIATSAVYDASTTVLLGAMPSLRSLVTDLDDDGAVTDHDVRLWLTGEIADRLEVRDFDGDGLVTAADEVYAVKTLLDRLRGDVDGTGTIGVLDTAAYLDLYLQPDPNALAFVNRPSADMNLDGAVTSDDLVEHLAAVGSTGPHLDTTRVAVDLLANVRGTLTADYYLQGHVFEISPTYPEHNTDNSRIPNGHPKVPNHVHAVSATWHATSSSRYWPPNHNSIVTRGWQNPWPHDGSVSASWPPEHDYKLSGNAWPSNHNRDVSSSWSPSDSVSPHGEDISRLWPPNHVTSYSNQSSPTQHDLFISPIREAYPADQDPDGWGIPALVPQRAPHDEWASSTWTDPNDGIPLHRDDLSRLFWPANHEHAASKTWSLPTSPHFANTSLTWPTNHRRAVSTGWPNNDPLGPRAWPANHGEAVSRSWPSEAQPADPIPWPNWFPEGHSVYTTTLELIPLLGTDE